jgi:DNA polymerase-3 subunit delta'
MARMSEVPDDQDGELHPRNAMQLFGHREAEAALLEAYRSGRMPHAWLIGGPPGIGKATLAYRMARFVLAHPDVSSKAVQSAHTLEVPHDDPAARKIASQSHTGLLVLKREINETTGKLFTEIRVDDVRRTVPFFGATAGEGGWRVAIVDSIDELNAAGENAILKMLEEPPPRALLLLVSHSPGRVIPTIRSRCRRLTLRSLPAADVAAAAAAISGREVDAEVTAAAGFAEGSIGRAIALLDEDTLALRQRIHALLEQLPVIEPRALHSLGDALGGTDPRAFTAFTDTVNAWLSARLHQTPQAASRLTRLAEAWDLTNRAAAEAEDFNLDRKPLIFSMFSQLAEATSG